MECVGCVNLLVSDRVIPRTGTGIPSITSRFLISVLFSFVYMMLEALDDNVNTDGILPSPLKVVLMFIHQVNNLVPFASICEYLYFAVHLITDI